MKVLKSYSLGIKRATSEGKLIWLLWLINVLFASVIYFQFSNYLNKVLSHSAAAEKFLKSFDINTFAELLSHYGEGLNTIISFAIFLMIGYIIATVFCNGGILSTLISPRKSGEKRRLAPLFFEGGGKFFGRFLRLLIYSLILWLGIAVIILILHMILNPITKGGTTEILLFYLIMVRVVIALFLVFLVKMIVEYARIKIVLEDTRKVFRSLFQAVGFVFRKLGSTLVIYYFFVLTAAAIFLIYWLVQKAFKTHALLPILIVFIFGQIFILSRGWVKVGLQAAQMNFFRSAVKPQIKAESVLPPTEKNSG